MTDRQVRATPAAAALTACGASSSASQGARRAASMTRDHSRKSTLAMPGEGERLLAILRAGWASRDAAARASGVAALPVPMLVWDGGPLLPCAGCGGLVFVKPSTLPLAGEGWACVVCAPPAEDPSGPMLHACAVLAPVSSIAAAAWAAARVGSGGEDESTVAARAASYMRAQQRALEVLAAPDQDLEEERRVTAGCDEGDVP